MPAVKAANPKAIFGNDIWLMLTRVSPWRGLALIMHAWVIAALTATLTALLWQFSWPLALLATPFAIIIIGGRQLGLAILMHEAAHGLTHKKRAINNFWGDWIAGAATGADLQAYRAYHLTHHRYTQQLEDPDLPLSQPFPVSKDSLRRKIIRDLTGQTFFKQRMAQFAMAYKGLVAMLRPAVSSSSQKRDTQAGTVFNRSVRTNTETRNGVSAPVIDEAGAIAMAKSVGRFLSVQIVLLVLALSLLGPAGGAIAYGIWFAALATTFPLFLRIRNIAEHACTATGSDDPFSHARTTYAGLLARMTVAPYWVNYHAEHHLFMAVPCYNLAKAHALLLEKNYGPRMTIALGYGEVLQQISSGQSKPATA